MCFVALETIAFCHAVLVFICDPLSLAKNHSFEAWFGLIEDLGVVSADRINSLEVNLSMFPSPFRDGATLRVVVDQCVDFYKFVACNLLTMQGMSDGIYRLMASVVPGVIPIQNVDVLVGRMRRQCNLWLLCDLGGMISLTVWSWSCTPRCAFGWGERENLPVFTPFSVCCAPWGLTVCLSTICAVLMSWLWARRPSRPACLLVTVIWVVVWNPMYDVLPDNVVSFARGAVSRVSDLHYLLDCSPWVEVDNVSWLEQFAAWRSSFGWTGSGDEVVVEQALCPEFCCLLSSSCAGLLNPAYRMLWRFSEIAIWTVPISSSGVLIRVVVLSFWTLLLESCGWEGIEVAKSATPIAEGFFVKSSGS